MSKQVIWYFLDMSGSRAYEEDNLKQRTIQTIQQYAADHSDNTIDFMVFGFNDRIFSLTGKQPVNAEAAVKLLKRKTICCQNSTNFKCFYSHLHQMINTLTENREILPMIILDTDGDEYHVNEDSVIRLKLIYDIRFRSIPKRIIFTGKDNINAYRRMLEFTGFISNAIESITPNNNGPVTFQEY